jgi:hypothetical protein
MGCVYSQFNVFDVDTDEVTVHPSDPFNPRYDVFKDWRLQVRAL